MFDVLIIGAGVSGLTAAYELKTKYNNDNFVLIEAQDRVGGKLHTCMFDLEAQKQLSFQEYTQHMKEWKKNQFEVTEEHSKYFMADLGGQWLGVAQKEVLELADKLKLKTYKQYEVGTSIMDTSAQQKPLIYSGLIPPLNPIALVDLQLVMWKIDAMAKEVPLDQPWNCKNAKEWDSKTIQSWLDQKCWTSAAKETLISALQVVMACNASEISLLSFLFYVHSCAGLEQLINGVGGAQDSKIVGGASMIPLRLVEEIGEDKVKLKSPVWSVDQSNKDYVIVTCKDGTEYKAKRVILAISPNLCGRMHFTPPMPGKRDRLCQKSPMGNVIKLSVIFKNRWWRTDKFSGFFVSTHGLVRACYDSCEAGIGFNGFIFTERAYEFMEWSQEKREDTIIEQFSRLFGKSKQFIKEQFVAILFKAWVEEEYERGAYEGFFTTGTLTLEGETLRKPIGRIYFAGTETALHHTGYISGAIDAGYRVAREVVESL